MSNSSRRIRKPNRRRSSHGLIIGLLVAGGIGLLLVVGGGLGVYFAFFHRGGGLPGVGGNPLDLPNLRVTEASYGQLTDGMTLPEAEAILGSSRGPTNADFDLLFGDTLLPYAKEQERQGNWIENNRKGLVRAWSNGGIRILILFNSQPIAGGRCLGRLLRLANGSVLAQFGTGQPPSGGGGGIVFGPMGGGGGPTVPNPNPGGAAPGAITADNLVAEFVANAGSASKKYNQTRVKVTGVIESLTSATVDFKLQNANYKFRTVLDGAAQAKIGRKKVGDTITLTGEFLYFTTGQLLHLNNCSLDD